MIPSPTQADTYTPSAVELENENSIVLWDRSILIELANEAKCKR